MQYPDKIIFSSSIFKSLLLAIAVIQAHPASSSDINLSGRVTTPSGVPVPSAAVAIKAGSATYSAVSGADGSYTLRISGLYSINPSGIEAGIAHPNPFSYAVNIPFIINSNGDVRFSVYTYTGRIIRDITFRNAEAGSYRVIWDGCSDNGSPAAQGLYIFALTFKGETRSGKIIKSMGFSSFASATTLEPVMLPPAGQPAQDGGRYPVIAEVSCAGYYTSRRTDITLKQDTVINFTISLKDILPYRTSGNFIAMKAESGYRPLILKGINLGACPPGTFPGEIAYSISPAMYETWIKRIGESGFNCIRIYTLHPPVFYEKLANYNNSHPEAPILLFQGIWLDEVEDGSQSQLDLFNRITSFRAGIEEVIDCIHGRKRISFRPGRAYGFYDTDVSQWTAAFIIGREIAPDEVISTNQLHSSSSSFSGTSFSITGGSATEVFVTRMLDAAADYENRTYNMRRPLSISSWPTLDPLNHPTETQTQEDIASFNIMKIAGKDQNAGIFATYHAYPYYPNFISQEPSYRSFSDAAGPNSYLGYITALKSHYSAIPLVIGEFGVPSSWGSAHESFSNMAHGGYSEVQQGEKNMRMMHNILDAGCAGGFMFAWMDEWFKPTWIVGYLEAFGLKSGNSVIPTRQLWHNLASPEQNFGLLSFDEVNPMPFVAYQTSNPTGPVRKIEATHDNSFFFLNIETSQPITAGDTVITALDTYRQGTGESRLPNGKLLSNRSEFSLVFVAGKDTSLLQVTEAYDMKGFTPRFNFTAPLKQKFKSTVSDGAPWNTVEWINDQYTKTSQFPGKLPAENRSSFSEGGRAGVAWSGSVIRIRIPWTLINYYDPTQMNVIDGASSSDGGYTFTISAAKSDGIAVSVYRKGSVTSSLTRYTWNSWLTVPETVVREKASLAVVASGMKAISRFAD